MELRAEKPDQIKQLYDLITKHQDKKVTINADLPNDLYPEVMHTDLWPFAVPPTMMVKDDLAKKIRANSIVSTFITEPVGGKKLLDFGCGDGHCVDAAKRAGADALGYDPNAPEGPGLTRAIADVGANGPYDIILVYDVLDHIVDDVGRASALHSIKDWLKPGGKVYVRCHPFTSRHGCHNYYKFNKAYAHLLLSEEELAKYDPLPTAPIVAPLKTYHQWFDQAKFAVASENYTRIPVEPLFRSVSIPLMKRLSSNTFVKDFDSLVAVIGIQFADYVIC